MDVMLSLVELPSLSIEETEELKEASVEYFTQVALPTKEEAYKYLIEHDGYLQKSKKRRDQYLWTLHKENFDVYHFLHGTEHEFVDFAHSIELDGCANKQKLKTASFCTSLSSGKTLDMFKFEIARLIRGCFGLECDNLVFSETVFEEEGLRVFTIDRLRCSVSDYLVFLCELVRLELVDCCSENARSFWVVDRRNDKVKIREKFSGSKYFNVTSTKKAVLNCFESSYCKDAAAFEMLREEYSEDDCITMSNLLSLGAWTHCEIDTETKRFDDIKDDIYSAMCTNELLILKAGTGCTKTVTVVKCLKKYICSSEDVVGKKVIFISNRVVYADSMELSINKIDEWHQNSNTHEFGDVKTASYTKYGGDIEGLLQNDIIFMSIESLRKLQQERDRVNNPFDVNHFRAGDYIIVLDEITETLSNIYRDTVCGQLLTFEYLKLLIENAHKVVTMSDDMTLWAVKALRSMRPNQRSFYYGLTQRSLIHDAYITSSVSLATQCLLNDVNNGKNIVIVCGSKKRSELISETLIEKSSCSSEEILEITSSKNENFLRENNIANWGNYRVVIYTPKITSGISFEGTHFHCVYAFLWNGLPIVTYKQMIARARKLIDNKVVYCFDKQAAWVNRTLSTNKAELVDQVQKAGSNIRRFIVDCINFDTSNIVDGITPERNNHRKMFKDMFFDVVIDKHKDLNAFEWRLYEHIILECKNNLKDIRELIDYEEVWPPTLRKNLIMHRNQAVIKQNENDAKFEAMLKEAEVLKKTMMIRVDIGNFRYKKRANGQLVFNNAYIAEQFNYLKRKEKLTEGEKIKIELYRLVAYYVDIHTFFEYTEVVVKDWVYNYNSVFSNYVSNWNSIGSTTMEKTLQLDRYNYDDHPDQMKKLAMAELDSNKFERIIIGKNKVKASVLIKIASDLFCILTGREIKSWKNYEDDFLSIEREVDKNNYEDNGLLWRDLVEEVTNKTPTPYAFLIEPRGSNNAFVYNPYMLVSQEGCKYLQQNISMIHCLLQKNKSRNDKQHFAGGKNSEKLLLLLKGTQFEFGKKMSFEHGKVPMAVVYNMFKKIINDFFGVSLIKTEKQYRVYNVEGFVEYSKIALEDVNQKRTDTFGQLKAVDEDEIDEEDVHVYKVYSVAFDQEDLQKRFRLSKYFSFLCDETQEYIPRATSKRKEQLDQRINKRRKIEKELVNE